MARVGRPPLPWGKNKSRDPNRRKIVDTQRDKLLGLTEKEKKEYKKKQHKEYLQRVKEDESRLEHLKESNELLRTMKESWEDFYGRVKENNKRRLDEILSDNELMWKIFADRDDLRTIEKKEMSEKNKDKKKYITDKEVSAIENYIYGGGKKINIDEEENDEDEWFNPYQK